MQITAANRCSQHRRPQPPGHTERLVAQAQRGDRAARDQIVAAHLRLVRSVARRYRNLGLPVDDLVQEGSIGLLAAIDEFDPVRGASFATHAYWRIRRAVTGALTANGRLVRLPKSTIERRHALLEARDALAATGHEPTVEDLAASTGIAAAAVAAALAAPLAPASLDAPLPDGTALEALLEDPAAPNPEAQAVLDEQRRRLDDALARLPERTRQVIEQHFGVGRNPASLGSIANELGLTTQRVRAIENAGLFALARQLEPVLQGEREASLSSPARVSRSQA